MLKTYNIDEILKCYCRRIRLASSFQQDITFILRDIFHEFRRIQQHQEIVPRNLSETFRIVLLKHFRMILSIQVYNEERLA